MKNSIIKKTEKFVQEQLKDDITGHDWWHSKRVRDMALRIAKKEKNIDLLVIELAALLHDLVDFKLTNSNDEKVIQWLRKLKISEERIDHIMGIIKNLSFKGAGVKSKLKTREGMIVQDADRLDALGAIGIARCFATGAKLGRKIYDPLIKPKYHQSFEDYKKSKSTSINHFYEKLLLLKDLLNTKMAKKIAEKRERFLKIFLKRFFDEWEGGA